MLGLGLGIGLGLVLGLGLGLGLGLVLSYSCDDLNVEHFILHPLRGHALCPNTLSHIKRFVPQEERACMVWYATEERI